VSADARAPHRAAPNVVLREILQVSNDVREAMREVFAAVLGCDPTGLDDQSSTATVRGWDSVNHMQLLLTLEDSFGVQFDPEEFASLTTFGALRTRIEAAAR
jgi:acyl carrier protein